MLKHAQKLDLKAQESDFLRFFYAAQGLAGILLGGAG